MAIRSPWNRISPVGPMYSMYRMSGALTVATGQTTGTMSYSVFSVQWLGSETSMHVSKVEVLWALETTFTTAQDVPLGLFKINAFTAAPTGGTPATLTAATSTTSMVNGAYDSNASNYGTSFGDSYFVTAGDIRMATTGLLTAGTGSIDKYPMKVWPGGIGTLQTGESSHNFSDFDPGGKPNTSALVIRYQQGFSIQPLVTMGAVGVIRLIVGMEWIEVPNQYA